MLIFARIMPLLHHFCSLLDHFCSIPGHSWASWRLPGLDSWSFLGFLEVPGPDSTLIPPPAGWSQARFLLKVTKPPESRKVTKRLKRHFCAKRHFLVFLTESGPDSRQPRPASRLPGGVPGLLPGFQEVSQRWYRARAARRCPRGGTGPGLSWVHQVVQERARLYWVHQVVQERAWVLSGVPCPGVPARVPCPTTPSLPCPVYTPSEHAVCWCMSGTRHVYTVRAARGAVLALLPL